MPEIPYIDKNFQEKSLQIIAHANQICQQYAAQGYDLTLRQLYYQFVARALIPNLQTEYKRLGSVINDARLAGYLDWDYIVDRTRNLEALPHWASPRHIVNEAADQFRMNMWDTQDYRPEVWIEKDALVGVIERVCDDYDVPYFSCRGYTSQSELWRAGQRLIKYAEDGKIPVIVHLGDHDPSGMDMTRDITDRLYMFLDGAPFQVHRIALNMNQIQQYNPPPNPTKFTDSRSDGYVAQFGNSSWELDALDPPVMTALIENELDTLIDQAMWDVRTNEIVEHQRHLKEVAHRWNEVTDLIEEEE